LIYEKAEIDFLDVNLTLSFENSDIMLTDKGHNLIACFSLNYELERINRLQLWGNVKELQEISLKYNQSGKRRSQRKKSN
jgi:hypothetical protein